MEGRRRIPAGKFFMKILRFTFRLLAAVVVVAGTSGCLTTPVMPGASSAVAELGPVFPGIASYIVVDANDGHVVMAHAANQKRPVASLTKLATAMTVLEYMKHSGGDAGEMMVVPNQIQLLADRGALGFLPGDRLAVRDGLYAAMMASDNAAAETLAVHFGQKLTGAGLGGGNPMAAFVSQMNGLVHRLGMNGTKFVNAHGLEGSGPIGYSTAADVARLTMAGLRTPGMSFYSSQSQRGITVVRDGAPRPILVRNTNVLLGRAGIDGGKTGTTTPAGPCLMITAPRAATVDKRPDGSTVVVPNRLIVVVLGASDRFNQAYTLLMQGWPAYERWRAAGSPVAAGTTIGVPAALP